MAIEISNWTELDAIREDLEEDYILINDLSSKDEDYEDIGDDWSPIGGTDNEFSGNFDGGGHTIYDLVINKPDVECVGFFGYIRDTGHIKNIRLKNISVIGDKYVGGLIGVVEAYLVSPIVVNDCCVIGNINGNSTEGLA